MRTVKPGHRIPFRPDWIIGVLDRTLLAPSNRSGTVRGDHRLRGNGRFSAALTYRGNRSRPRVGACAGRSAQLGPRLETADPGDRPLILVNLSGRGDKDVDTAIKWFGLDTAGTASESADASTDTGPTR